MITNVYIDGFNLYYRALKDTPFRWLDLRKLVTLVNPDPRNTSPAELAAAATYVKRLWKSHLRRSQFPDTLTDKVGVIIKPAGW